ncbi:MAG: hypothetical protein DI556_06555 [Rhodovulum sulfidophilum]|uniref:Glycoside hydrolase family 5 domain-containing protein n=1 Tax=Rhodovulum sulfidophilum TaxID=35806 RepID=A0A2W5NCF9_RHOSU|nr:MAG: hypothetical protein DI556_06555 [Rhodovulum sulfidophilum]
MNNSIGTISNRIGIVALVLALVLGADGALARRAGAEVTPAPGELGLSVGLDALRWQDGLDLAAEFADYARLGARWLRVDLNWSVIQAAGPDSFDWSTMDRILAGAEGAGLRVLPVPGSAPAWLDGGAGPATPEARAAYAAFLAAAVARYAPRGVRVWEIWNEPNLAGFWPPAPDQVAYARLLEVAFAAIKAADPGARVLFGGLSPVPDVRADQARARGVVPAVRFLADAYANGAGGSFDALSFHPYTWPETPESPEAWTGWNIMTGPIRDLMIAEGDADKKIWITEFGAPTNPGGVDDGTQARILEQGIRLARGYPWAGPLLWYSYRDLGTDPADSEDWYGLVGPGRTPKPAYAAFRALATEAR